MDRLKNSLFAKLNIIMMLVIILPSVVSNVIAYRQNYYMVQNQIIEWNQSMMDIGMEDIVSYIREIEQAPLNLFGNADLIRIFKKPTAFTDMDRYVIRKYGSQISERAGGIFKITMDCVNGETIDEIYTSDAMIRKQINSYQYPEQSESAFQMGRWETGIPEFLVYNTDIQDIPSFDTIVNMRIFVNLERLQAMEKTLNGQYNDSIVMVYFGGDLAYTSAESLSVDYDGQLQEKGYMKGTLNGEAGIFFIKTDSYKGNEIKLVKFVNNHWFTDPAQKVVIGAVIVQGFLLAVSAIFLFLIFNMFISPVRRMLSNMKAVEEKPEFVYKLGTRRKDELGILENQYAGMMKSLDELINKNYRNQLEVTKSRFKMLQAQINPHFLYNMLQYISTTALKHNCPEVSTQLTQLGELFQYTLNKSGDVVTLQQELHHLENYVALQEGRFGGRLHFIINCPDHLCHMKIPKMILQPLVENSIKHGIDKKDGVGSIMVSITDSTDGSKIRVIDNGAGMNDEQIEALKSTYKNYEFTSEAGHGIGFLNVLQRCSIFYGKRFEWNIKSIPEMETIVEIVIKKEMNS